MRMGARGPRPKPTNLRVLHGDRKDRINNDEPPAPDGEAVCPAGVAPAVREVWDYTVAQLAAMGCASPADRDSLLCYCEAVVTHRKASEILARSQVLIRRKDSDVLMRNPALTVQRDAALLIARFAQHFGLSPSARSEIRNPKGTGNAQDSARFLTG
jgi:P27 family predicted phage terminase small subunit